MDTNNKINEVESNTEPSVDTTKSMTRDTGLDIASLLKAKKEEKPKSALEELKEAKENGSMGLIVDNKELNEKNGEKKLITNKAEHDAIDEIDAYLAEQDKLIEAAKHVHIDKVPVNAEQKVAMMNALDDVANNRVPSDTGTIQVTVDSEKNESSDSSETVNTPNNDTSVIDDTKQSIVNVLIDKTGMGGEFKFTDDEKEKIFTSTEIRLKEVEEVDLSSIKVKKAEKSFMESVNEFQISSSKVPVVFPASRFRAYMTGLSYGEMGDISLNSENITFDQIHKKLTVVYNKMINPSIGKFESFEDFLRKFAYVDIDIAVYGLVVATFPEIDDIPLNCNSDNCKKQFYHKFSPRTLIRFEKSDNKFLEAMRDVVECKATDFDKLVEESPTRAHKRIRLPYSGFIVEIGIASSYDYLYTIVDNMLGDKFKEEHPDDVNGILQLNSTLLGLIRAVYVPDGNEYVEYTEFEDMINALYMIKPEEIAILASLLQKYTDGYAVHFELFDIQCPHCGVKTKRIPIDINQLVFLKYQRLMSTEINIDSIAVL